MKRILLLALVFCFLAQPGQRPGGAVGVPETPGGVQGGASFLPLVIGPETRIPVAAVLAPFDADRQDLFGPSSWNCNYGKHPELVVAANGKELDVLANDYDPATPWKAVLLHLAPGASGGYKVTQALTDLPVLDRIMGLGVDAQGNRYYATAVNESQLISPTYPPLDTYRSNIVRVVKVDPAGQVLFDIDLDTARHDFSAGAEMIINPMDAAGARLAVGGGQILLAHGINTDPDWNIEGRRHQKALTTRLDAASGAILEVYSIWVSHSFDQRLMHDGNDFVELYLGDAYPRSVAFAQSWHEGALFHIKGALGENRTYTRLGNVALIENDPEYRYLALFVTENSAEAGDYPQMINGPRDLAMVRVLGNDFGLDPDLPDTLTVDSKGEQQTNRLRWLTHYPPDSDLHAERPKLIGLGGDRFVVLWEEWRHKGYEADDFLGVYAMLIDARGETLRPATLLTTAHHLPRGDDAFLLDGRAAWLTGSAAGQYLVLHFVDGDLNYQSILVK